MVNFFSQLYVDSIYNENMYSYIDYTKYLLV